jgi:hypothetical protein
VTIVAWKEAKEHATLTSTAGGRREWSAPYILTSDNPRDDGQACVDFMDTIGRGLSDTFRYADREDSTVWCKKVTPTRIPNSVLHWQVVCEYSPLEPKESSEDEDGNPTDDPMNFRYDISTGIQYFQVPVYQAWNMDQMPKDGTAPGYIRALESLGPVHNSAGVVYDPPLLRELPESVLRISGNALYYDDQYFYLPGTINEFTLRWSQNLAQYGFLFTEMKPCCVLCAGVSADYQRQNGLAYWRYTFEWRIRQRTDATDGSVYGGINPQDGFLETILDRGISRIANAGAPDGKGGTITMADIEVGMAEATPIRDWQGDRVPELVLLDGHGRPLQGSRTDQAPPVYFRWRVHPYGVFTYPFVPLKIFK